MVMRRILQLLSAPQSSPLDDQRRMGWRPLTPPDQQWKGRAAIARRGSGAPDEIGSRHCSSRQPQFAQYARPIAFRPISQAPAVQATGEQLQVIFFADADRAMNGMGNGSNLTCRETGAMLGDGGVSQLWLKSRTRRPRLQCGRPRPVRPERTIAAAPPAACRWACRTGRVHWHRRPSFP